MMLGGPCSSCCNCTPDDFLETYIKLSASSCSITLSGSAPSQELASIFSDSYATLDPGTGGSTYVAAATRSQTWNLPAEQPDRGATLTYLQQRFAERSKLAVYEQADAVVGTYQMAFNATASYPPMGNNLGYAVFTHLGRTLVINVKVAIGGVATRPNRTLPFPCGARYIVEVTNRGIRRDVGNALSYINLTYSGPNVFEDTAFRYTEFSCGYADTEFSDGTGTADRAPNAGTPQTIFSDVDFLYSGDSSRGPQGQGLETITTPSNGVMLVTFPQSQIVHGVYRWASGTGAKRDWSYVCGGPNAGLVGIAVNTKYKLVSTEVSLTPVVTFTAAAP